MRPFVESMGCVGLGETAQGMGAGCVRQGSLLARGAEKGPQYRGFSIV